MTRLRAWWPALLLVLIVAGLLFLSIGPYGRNITALFHLDTDLHERFPVPSGFVVLTVPAYDGAQYYELARLMPKIIDPSTWDSLPGIAPGPYAWQRILLPTMAFVLSLGREHALPFAFLAIQILSLLAAFLLFQRSYPQKELYAFALALSPAATVGLHYMLAEPLTILLFTALLVRFKNAPRLDGINILLLSALVLTREINVLLLGLLFLYFLWKKQWRDAAMLSIPGAVFLAWHVVIFLIFDQIPFLWSTDKRTLPLQAIIELLLGEQGYNRLTLTSIPLFLLVVLPGTVWLLGETVLRKERSFIPLAALAFLGVMLTMPDHIWGSITSIGRVITPVYPLILFHAASRDTWTARFLAASILLIGIGATLALATSIHPYFLAP